MTWWCSSIDKAIDNGHTGDGLFGRSRMSPLMFDARGIAPIGYAAFAFALGVTAGLVIRRTVPAIAVTLAVFVAIQLAMPSVRAHLDPAQFTTRITAANLGGLMMAGSPETGPVGSVRDLTVRFDKPGAWIIANQTINAAGHVDRSALLLSGFCFWWIRHRLS